MNTSNEFKTIPLSEMIISINAGLNPRNNFRLNEEGANCLYFNVRNLQKNPEASFDMISTSAMNIIKQKCKLEKGDILMPAILTNQYRIMRISDSIENIGISENVYAIKPKNNINGDYLYYILQTPFIQEQIKKMVGNNLHKRITKNMLKNILIPAADKETQIHITNTMDKLNRISKEVIFIKVAMEHFFEHSIKYNESTNSCYFLDFFDIDFQNNINKILKASSMLANKTDKAFEHTIDKHL